MDELLEQLERLCGNLVLNFEMVTFEELTDFMEQREEIFNELQHYEVSAIDKLKYKDLVNRILSYDPIIVAKMEQLKHEAEKELNKVASGRIQKNAYEGEHQLTDGMFFDQKK
jgi:hypothetical protein